MSICDQSGGSDGVGLTFVVGANFYGHETLINGTISSEMYDALFGRLHRCMIGFDDF